MCQSLSLSVGACVRDLLDNLSARQELPAHRRNPCWLRHAGSLGPSGDIFSSTRASTVSLLRRSPSLARSDAEAARTQASDATPWGRGTGFEGVKSSGVTEGFLPRLQRLCKRGSSREEASMELERQPSEQQHVPRLQNPTRAWGLEGAFIGS